MILDVIIMFLNIAIILILAAHLVKKKDDSKDIYDKYRNQDGLLMRNKNKK